MQSRARALDLVTLPFPGFPTDLQPPMMVLLATAEGSSILTENVF
jgi:UDP-N-acetylglucosamine 1-carboxyvinyltransferase